jgi:hypothetical protein
MSLRMVFRPGMRTYFIPLTAGLVLASSAFLPWVIVGGESMRGVPDAPALWVVGLGLLAAVLALLSLITRKNSRHPLLLVGLVALGITFLASRLLPRAAGEQELTKAQAWAIVENGEAENTPASANAGWGIYLGIVASLVIVGFGLTIVIKRVSRPYDVPTADDDVD